MDIIISDTIIWTMIWRFIGSIWYIIIIFYTICCLLIHTNRTIVSSSWWLFYIFIINIPSIVGIVISRCTNILILIIIVILGSYAIIWNIFHRTNIFCRFDTLILFKNYFIILINIFIATIILPMNFIISIILIFWNIILFAISSRLWGLLIGGILVVIGWTIIFSFIYYYWVIWLLMFFYYLIVYVVFF